VIDRPAVTMLGSRCIGTNSTSLNGVRGEVLTL